MKEAKPESCPNRADCDSSCGTDQREWCALQFAMLRDKTDSSVWAFVLSLLPLARATAKKHSAKLGWVEVDSFENHFSLQLFRRFRKELDKGTFYVRNKLKGYVSVCAYGEIL